MLVCFAMLYLLTNTFYLHIERVKFYSYNKFTCFIIASWGGGMCVELSKYNRLAMHGMKLGLDL